MKFLKDFTIAFLIGVLIFILLIIVQYFIGSTFFPLEYLFVSFCISQLYSVSLYFVNAYYFRVILKWSSKKTVQIKSLLIRAVGSIFVSILTIFILNWLVDFGFNKNTFSEFLAKQKIQNYYITTIITTIVIGVFYFIYYKNNKKDLKIAEQKIIAGTASAKFEALRSQLDPHFLFNSLNVLTSLIEENPELASKFTTTLSKVYRYVLEQKEKELVSLAEELEFAKEYISLMQVRFEDSIVFDIPDKIKHPNAKVVPLALQLLLENAVKHNQLTPERKLHISIVEEDSYLIVTNNLQHKQIWSKGTKLGLQNIVERYTLLTSSPVHIRKTADTFQVEIPLLDPEMKIAFEEKETLFVKDYAEAKNHVNNLRGFYLHLAAYLLFCIGLLYINLSQPGNYYWSIFPIVGWGIGILSHGTSVFQWRWFFSKAWEERKIKEYMDKKL